MNRKKLFTVLLITSVLSFSSLTGCGASASVDSTGSKAESNMIYSKMQTLLTDRGFANYYVGTVEASPSLEDLLALVKQGGYKKVVLEPLMVVAGDHANNDMAGDEDGSWKKEFENAGYEVECILQGLGENEAIRSIYVDHARAAIERASA